ncbi:DedA family protein [Clostridium sardiniense]|uniref:DedA family protein n=1 Tax=Clostridium sardiniense TaxID=29369 RepID=A0ABS7L392_CLOSR|nr:DedA family protein [Clostridium sardiniense]MBY0757392.1 DedA family protein [Clostridium sardiniense]MDQ0461981.1 membrane protein DedA with SNARE-associated domain [Clostridium sardiniense]
MSEIIDWLITFTESMGYIGILIVVALEYACFPMSSEILLPLIGMLVYKGELNYLLVVITSILAGIIGSTICYFVGFIGGGPLLNYSKLKFPKTRRVINSLNRWFNIYGKIAVLIARVVPITRTYVSILAGAQKLNYLTFIAYSSIGIAFWNTVLILIGYFLGDNFELITILLKKYSNIIVLLIIIIIFIRHKIKNKKRRVIAKL